jgi:hypothetical protein
MHARRTLDNVQHLRLASKILETQRQEVIDDKRWRKPYKRECEDYTR